MMIDEPIPLHGPAKLNRDKVSVVGFVGSKIVQHGSTFRLRSGGIVVTLSADDALWAIETLELGAKPHEFMRRVVVWSNDDRDIRA